MGHETDPPMVKMAREHYASYRWVLVPIVALATWSMIAPFTFGGASTASRINDVVCGAIALALALAAIPRTHGLVCWSIAGVGTWMLFAPLLWWAPDPASYANDTVVGALLVAFALIVPMGMQMKGPSVPPGWSYNPSAWSQRAPSIALAWVSLLAAHYMASYQLGHIDRVWDPFFGDGTARVLHSEVSRAWPVSDAGLGAMTYTLELLMGLMGDQRRWRTMPWMVAGFGFVVVPLGVVSIALVIMQPLVVGQWCTWCLFTAAAMLLMIPLSLDEVVAMIQFVARKRRQGHSAWRVFWLGGELDEAEAHVAAPVREDSWRPRAMLWGFTGSWPLVLSALAGIALMIAPDLFGVSIAAAAADLGHLVGALVVVVAVIAMAEVARPARLLDVPLGLACVVAPWFLDGATPAWAWTTALLGLVIAALGLPRGRVRDHYGAYDRVVAWGAMHHRGGAMAAR